jgi:hypothetical protein
MVKVGHWIEISDVLGPQVKDAFALGAVWNEGFSGLFLLGCGSDDLVLLLNETLGQNCRGGLLAVFLDRTCLALQPKRDNYFRQAVLLAPIRN